MAVATWLRAVSERQLEELGQNPELLADLAAAESHHTYFALSINYFLTGDAYPGDHALAPIDDLVDEEKLDNLEFLEHDDIPVTLIDEVTNLAAFYGRVAEAGHGVVMYTT